jgi:Ulp1 family protease
LHCYEHLINKTDTSDTNAESINHQFRNLFDQLANAHKEVEALDINGLTKYLAKQPASKRMDRLYCFLSANTNNVYKNVKLEYLETAARSRRNSESSKALSTPSNSRRRSISLSCDSEVPSFVRNVESSTPKNMDERNPKEYSGQLVDKEISSDLPLDQSAITVSSGLSCSSTPKNMDERNPKENSGQLVDKEISSDIPLDQSAITVSSGLSGSETLDDESDSLSLTLSSATPVTSLVTIPRVPEESKARIQELMSCENRKIATYGEIKLMTNDLQTLAPRAWLNSSVIDAFIFLLSKESKARDYKFGFSDSEGLLRNISLCKII